MADSLRVHFFHLIWSTKKRQNFILPKMQSKLYAYIGGTIHKNKCSLLEIGGIANHIHMLVEILNLDQFSALIRSTNASSTTGLKKEFPECHYFAWQDGYGSFSVSYSQLDRVREYIQKQEEHHQKQTFEEEYIKLLNIHQIAFNPEYVFD